MTDPMLGWDPFYAGALKRPLDDVEPVGPGAARIILRRAALELRAGDVVNLGAGVATGLPRIALEEGVLDAVTFTNEHGVFGGLMGTAFGASFVPAVNAGAVMDSGFQFNFYDGGGLDIAFLGIGEADATGNLNVSRFGPEINGPGGFCNIIEKTPRIVFCGTLTAGGLRVAVEGGALSIVQEGRNTKFVEKVEQVTFNAARALSMGKEVLYVTERCVFRLEEDGPLLVEIAPGIALERDVGRRVGFPLRVARDLRPMPPAAFDAGPLRLAEILNEKEDAR
jgi:acyl CoA:acetate/3-ketoacid CoA transferase